MVRSSELEAATGLTRYDLARQFRAAFNQSPHVFYDEIRAERARTLLREGLARQFRAAVGTSPYRYSLMRRLDCARAQLRSRRSLADVALATGFADQAHLTRKFKAAFGITPARYRALGASRPR